MGAAIAISLLVSFTLTPMLASRLLRLPPATGRRKSFLERFSDWFYKPIERVYLSMLGFVLRHRWVIVLAAFGTLGSCVPLVKAVPKAFLPKNDEAQFQIDPRATRAVPQGKGVGGGHLGCQALQRPVPLAGGRLAAVPH